jgi:hypothetical protein
MSIISKLNEEDRMNEMRYWKETLASEEVKARNKQQGELPL